MKTKSSKSKVHLKDFWIQAVVNYKETGAIAPSSPYLARLIADHSGLENSKEIVEIGPGTGVFTEELLRRLPPKSRLTLIEKNSCFVNLLRQKFPGLTVLEACATKLDVHLGQQAISSAGAVVSGLPWAAMPDSLQETLLQQIHGILAEDGVFTTFAYFGPHLLPSGQRFRKRLEQSFAHVSRTKIEMRNFPPAFVYRATKIPPTRPKK